MTIYDENIRVWQQHATQLLPIILSLPATRGKTIPAKNGSLTLLYSPGPTPVFLHSRFNPETEAEKILQNKNTAADHIIVLGLGLGYHLDKLMDKKAPLSRVLLIEPDLEIVAHSLHTLRWERLFNCRDVFYILGPNLAELPGTLQRYIHMAIFHQLEIIELAAETRLMENFFHEARQIIDKEVRSYLYDFKTRLEESYAVPRNIMNNLPGILESRPMTRLKDFFKGIPGFIIAAGPSLDRNVLHLAKIRDRGIIIAVDTALKPLLMRSIQPHFTAVGDPSHKNYLHVQGMGKQLKNFILAETAVAHQVFCDFPHIFTLSIDRPLVRIIERQCEPLGTVDAWGTVTCIALDFAVYLGLNPIVFLGQDFAYTHTRNHCRGTSWEELHSEYFQNLDTMQRFEKYSISGNRKIIETTDIYGNNAFTSDRLILYKNFLARVISKYPNTRFINASEGGIFNEITPMPFYHVLQQYIYGRPPVDFNRIYFLPPLSTPRNLESLQSFLNQSSSFFQEYLEHIKNILSLLNPIQTKSLPISDSLSLVKQLETLQQHPYSGKNLEKGQIIEMWSPAPIYHFMKAYQRLHNSPLTNTTINETLGIYRTYFSNIKPILEDVVFHMTKTHTHLSTLEKRENQ